MYILFDFLFGFLTAVIGIFPPGLLNISAAKISLKEGRVRGVLFASGATLVVMFQSYIAILFSRYIDRHPHVIELLQEVGFFIFLLLTIYFLFFAKKKEAKEDLTKKQTKKSRFLLGAFLSSINLFPIPFYVLVIMTLSRREWFNFEQAEILLFVLGAVIGTFFMFYMYMVFFKRLESGAQLLMKNSNYIIGTITGIVTVITLFKIINVYCS